MYTFHMNIISADIPDINRLAEISRLSLKDSWTEGAFKGALYNERVWVLIAKSREEIIGFCVFSVAADEAELQSIAVDPCSRRQGAGRALFNSMLSEAKVQKAAVLYLDVRQGNDAAIAFYRDMGMEEIAVRKGFYESPREDALIFRMDILDTDNA